MVLALGFEGVPLAGVAADKPSVAPDGQPFFNITTGQWEVYDSAHGSSGGWRNWGVCAEELTFTETDGAGTYTGEVDLPAGAVLHDIIVNGVALWTATTSATLKVGDGTDDDGYFTGVNLKATDLLAGESLSFSEAGGKAGAYIANNQVSPRYSATARTIAAVVTTVGAAGDAGRTRVTVIYSLPRSTAATKA